MPEKHVASSQIKNSLHPGQRRAQRAGYCQQGWHIAKQYFPTSERTTGTRHTFYPQGCQQGFLFYQGSRHSTINRITQRVVLQALNLAKRIPAQQTTQTLELKDTS